jgi:hypothetical protein
VQNAIKKLETTVTGLTGQLTGMQGQLTGTQGQLAVAHNTIAAMDVETAKRVLLATVGTLITTCITTYVSTIYATQAGEKELVKTTFAWQVSTLRTRHDHAGMTTLPLMHVCIVYMCDANHGALSMCMYVVTVCRTRCRGGRSRT